MIYLLVLASGFAGLVYEVLWMKQLGLLFGNTSHAAAATLGAFFTGLAAGSWFWGRRAAGMRNPLRAYAWLEAGIAATALIYFVILAAYYRIYPLVYQHVGSASLRQLIKFGLALLLIFPPAFCMGGTLPVMGQHAIRNLSRFGALSALLYGVNTLGAALGAGLAGFFLPLWLGFKATCAGAMLISAAVAAAAFVLSRKEGARCRAPGVSRASDVSPVSLEPETRNPQAGILQNAAGGGQSASARWAILPLCFLSGFGVLALEVLWTRMFAQVLDNSVYTFAAILVLVLVCLATGALLSSRLARLEVSPWRVLALLALLSGLAVALTPFVFMRVTHAFEILAFRVSWPRYVWEVFKHAGLVIAIPALLSGTVFPFLMKMEERHADSAGWSLGRLSAVNTAGAILGSLLCGFVFLGALGMWGTMRMLAVLYLLAAVVIPSGWNGRGVVLRVAGVTALWLAFSALDPTGLPVTAVDRRRAQEEVVEVWEGSDCTVAVVRDPHGLSIKVNSDYGLGSTGAFMQERLQNDLPLMVWPRTKSIFFLGVGTGITAGGALDPQFTNVARVVACELVPEVLTAARKYITNWNGRDCTGGLFTDPRVTLLAEDGRHYLMAAPERFDMVNGELFIPFRSGAGSLYSREHFESVRARLAPGGVFVQWLPLYQVTEHEFGIIVRTMLEVFPQVSLWRISFQPGEEVVALVGHADARPLPFCDMRTGEARRAAVAGKAHRNLGNLLLPFNPGTMLFFYGGNLTAARERFAGYPVNTDDKPVIEYMAPRTYRDAPGTVIPWFVGPRIAQLVDEVQRICPPDRDPLLVDRATADRRLPVAGAAFHWARLWEIMGDEEKCRASWERFVRAWTAD